MRTRSVPITRADQVYVINGNGMEYVVPETGHSAAHVIVNDSILYEVTGDKFAFFDQEGRRHSAGIARQTLIEPGARVKPEPTIWKSVPGGDRLFVRKSPESFYAEQLLAKKAKGVPTKYEATWKGNQFVGTVNWTIGKCLFTREVDLTVKTQRIEGFYSGPVSGSKFDSGHCRYGQPFRPISFVWVPK